MTAKDGTQRDGVMGGAVGVGVEIAIQEETEYRRGAIKAKDGGCRDVKKSATNRGVENQETTAMCHMSAARSFLQTAAVSPRSAKFSYQDSGVLFIFLY